MTDRDDLLGAAAYQASRMVARGFATKLGTSARDESHLITISLLHHAHTATRNIAHEFGRVQPESIDIDEIEVGTHSWRDPPPVMKTHQS